MSHKKPRTKRPRNTAQKFPARRAARSSEPEIRPGAPIPIVRPAALIVPVFSRGEPEPWKYLFLNVSQLRYAEYFPARPWIDDEADPPVRSITVPRLDLDYGATERFDHGDGTAVVSGTFVEVLNGAEAIAMWKGIELMSMSFSGQAAQLEAEQIAAQRAQLEAARLEAAEADRTVDQITPEDLDHNQAAEAAAALAGTGEKRS